MEPYPFETVTSINPDFSRCGTNNKCVMACGLKMHGSENVFIYGAGLYNFFQNYDHNCLNGENCQESIVNVDSTTNKLFLYNLNTKATTMMLSIDKKGFALQEENRNTFCSTISGFLTQSHSNSKDVYLSFFQEK